MSPKLFNRNFSLVIVGQIISLFGNSILRFSLSLLVLDITGSALVFGTISAISIIPVIILSPIGGIIADRVNKRNIMAILDFGTALIMLLSLFVMFHQDNASMTITITTILLLLLSIIQSIYNPAVQASIPILQAPEHLIQSNAIVNQVTSLAGLLGPVLGGLLYGYFGILPILIVSGLCFLFSAILELFISIPHQPRNQGASVVWMMKEDTKESLHFILKDKPEIFNVMLQVALFNLVPTSMLAIGLPFMVKVVLQLGSELYGALEGCMALAGIIGGILAGIMAGRFKTKNLFYILILIGIMIAPMGIAFMGTQSARFIFVILVLCSMVIQLLANIFSILGLSAVQGQTPQDLLGKVMSYILTFSMCAQPVGQAIYGVLFDFSASVSMVILSTSIITILLGGLSRKAFIRLSNEQPTKQSCQTL